MSDETEVERLRAALSETPAFLCFNDWAGFRKEPCFIVGETPKRYRVRADSVTRLAGRNRYLHPGETALVPKTAVQFASRPEDGRDDCQFCLGKKGGVKGNENVINGVIVCDYCSALIMRIETGFIGMETIKGVTHRRYAPGPRGTP